jgi:site-specific DNA-cytosine methylase
VALSLNAAGGTGRLDYETETLLTAPALANPLTARMTKGINTTCDEGQTPIVIGFADVADPVAANQARTYTREGSHNFRVSNVALSPMAVRRLTPRECERLQGFPDDYTLIAYRGKPAKDGPRYKALGNSMAVPVMAWLGRRIDALTTVVP